jgi:hypothetical protein
MEPMLAFSIPTLTSRSSLINFRPVRLQVGVFSRSLTPAALAPF